MFKKSLLAVAITAFAGVATAHTLSDTEVKYASENLTTASAAISFDDAAILGTNGFNVTIGGHTGGLAAGDKLVLKFANAEFAVGTNAAINSAVNAAGSCVNENNDGFDSTFAYSDANTVTLTLAGNDTIADAEACEITGLVFAASSLNSGDVKVTAYSADNVNLAQKLGEVSKTLVKFGSAFAVKASAGEKTFEEKINVAEDRKLFANDTATDKAEIGYSVGVTGVVKSPAITNGSASVTINSDFTFLDIDGDGKLGGSKDLTLTTDDASDTITFASGLQSVVILDDAENGVEVTLQGGDKTTELPQVSFSADVTFKYNDAASKAQTVTKTGISLGAWKLNGDTTHVSFMPFSDAFSQSVTVDNKSAVDGEITIVWYLGEDKKVSSPLTTIATGYNVTDISAELRSVAAEKGITGNVAFDLVVNAPDGNVNVTALYYAKADQDRAVVLSE